MTDLDDVLAMKALDKGNVYGSIRLLPDQAQQAWDEIAAMSFPDSYRRASAIVVSGMGGSLIGAHLVQTAFRDKLRVPFLLSNNYALPNFVGPRTLVVVSSYSGGTEETLASSLDAVKRKALVTGITVGGKLGEFLRQQKLTSYIFNPRYNPAGQPRLAVGYSVMAQIALFSLLDYLRITSKEAGAVISLLREGEAKYGVDILLDSNPAKQLAKSMAGKIPVLVVAEHLEGAIHVFNNQLNESAKSYSDFRIVPELNHHLMEGLAHPPFLKEGMVFVFFPSSLYHPQIQRRFPLTQEVVEKNGIQTTSIPLTQKTRLLQAFELLLLGSYVNYYLAMHYNIDPQPIPWVTYFKEHLS